ncbi:MAG: GNAT family N-acetyltransferase [Gemmatimonadales bacterium]
MPERGSRLRFRTVRDPSDPVIPEAHRLLRRIFTTEELVRRRDLREAIVERNRGFLGDLNWHMIVAERDGRLVGVATVSYIGELNIGVVGYLAVRPGERAGGLGLKLRARLMRLAHHDALRRWRRPLRALVGEVRADNPWLRHLVQYHDALALDFPYWQPCLDGRARPVRLVLYFQPISRDRQSLGADEVRRLVYTIWRRLYRVARPMNDPAFRRMLKAIEGRRTIGSKLPPALRAPSGTARRTRRPTSSRRPKSSPRTAGRSRRRSS